MAIPKGRTTLARVRNERNYHKARADRLWAEVKLLKQKLGELSEYERLMQPLRDKMAELESDV